MAELPRHANLVTVTDGHQARLAWMGRAGGHPAIPLGAAHFGQTGLIADLCRHCRIDANAIVDKVNLITPARPARLAV